MANVFGKTLLSLVAASVAAGSLAAQDPESTFQEGVRALRLGQREEALAKFQQVLAADPSHEQAFEIWRKTDQDMWRWLMLEQGDIQKVAQELQSRARLRRKELSRDQAAIDELVNTACTAESFGDRRVAISKLVADHGEFAVPALVKKLGNADDSKGQDYALVALHALGSVATLPLIEALGSDSALVRRNAAAALAHIGDDRAAPALLAAAANDGSQEVRYVAAQGAKRLDSSASNAVESFLAIAERYLSGRGEAGVTSEVDWNLVDGALAPVDVPASVFPVRVAQRFALGAWRADPSSAKAVSTFARALLAEAAAIESATAAAGDTAPDSLANLANTPADLRVKALALGPAVLRNALQDARAAGMAPVAVECAKLLAGVEDRASLASSPLVDGLRDDDKRVAYACALALVEASGGAGVPAAEDVVRVLGNAATEESLRTILVVDGSESVRRTAVEALSSKRGEVVEACATGTRAVGSLVTFPVVDAVVINQDLPDVVPEHVIGLIRKDPRRANTKVVVIANDVEAATARFGDRIHGVIKGPLTGEALSAKVNEVLADVDLGAKRKWAESVAASATTALASLAASGLNLGGATKQLAEQLNRADAVSVPAAKALAASGSTADLDALVAVLSGSGSVDLKKAAASAIGAVLHRAGRAPTGLVDELTAALAGADQPLRMAIVGALGRAGLMSGERLKLMDAVQAALGANSAARTAEGEAGSGEGQ